MRVAVVIPAHNVAPYIGAAITSVLCQSHADLSLTVVEDGSVDGTRSVLAGFTDKRLQIIETPGCGVSAARNLGAGGAKADALLFLDGDDWLAPDALARLTAALAPDAKAAAVHGPFAFVDADARPDAPGKLDRRAVPPAPDLLPLLMLGNLFRNGGHVLIRTAAWQAAGPYREDIAFAEDWEFWLRLSLVGPFLALRGAPLLFVRRRAGSAMHQAATRLEAYRPALAAIAENGAIAERLGLSRFTQLLQQAELEVSWTLGREMLRRGDAAGARPLLWRGVRGRPRPQRLAILALALATRSPVVAVPRS